MTSSDADTDPKSFTYLLCNVAVSSRTYCVLVSITAALPAHALHPVCVWHDRLSAVDSIFKNPLTLTSSKLLQV